MAADNHGEGGSVNKAADEKNTIFRAKIYNCRPLDVGQTVEFHDSSSKREALRDVLIILS